MTLKLISSTEAKGTYVIDARSRQEYDRGHIPGAVHLEWEAFVESPDANPAPFNQKGWWGRLLSLEKDRETIQNILQEAGLEDGMTVTVYADGPASKGREGRLAWTLLYLSVENLNILNGGFSQWCKEQEQEQGEDAIETGAPQSVRKECRFTIKPDDSRRIKEEAMVEVVQENSATIWDVRTKDEFDGLLHPYLPRKGHIPGASLMPFPSLFEEGSTRFIDRDTYLKMLGGKRIEPIAYCELGLRAATLALIHEIYTGEKLRIFDSGFIWWSLNSNLPVIGSIY
ncbi:hypothetical protein GC174_11065 [bacterium]|nr:hypothetical protein [bacterium]